MGGAENFVEIEAWGEDRQGFLRRFLPYRQGIASHDTLNDVMNALDSGLDRIETTDGDHGRIEIRRHVVSHDVNWLSTDRRFPGEPRFLGLKAIAMVETEVERDGKISRERRYYLSSALLDARFFARAVRCHWHIENRLHWVLDVVFHDDLARLRSGCGPQNMAVIKHMAMNLIRKAPGEQSRKKVSWNADYLETIIRQRG